MRFSSRYLSGLIVAAATASSVVLAQTQTPPPAERGPPLSRQNPKPADPAPPSAKKEAAPADQQAADAKAAPRKRPALPETPAERDKMLSDLYAHLATAVDEESARHAAENIERVWRHSGSDTVW